MVDVIIIGGGPAGSSIGAYLSNAGVSNMILESAVHPRAHVGESLVASTTRVMKELGFLETVEREAFIHKFGATWHAPRSEGTFSIRFGEFPIEDIDQDYSYHVDRSRFDMLLLRHAETLGSDVHEATPVKHVIMDGDRAVGVRATIDGVEQDLRCKFVVDASGRASLLGNQLKLKEKDPLFDQYAVHAWFEGVDRGPEETADDIHIYFLEVERGWAWQIPITEEVTSMGVVADRKVFKAGKSDYGAYFDSLLAGNSNFARSMKGARRINDFKADGDYSYTMKRFAGPGYVLVGDAARFVDPIFSSGVSVALECGRSASKAIVKSLADGNGGEAAALAEYEQRLKKGVTIWYEFITLYYKLLPLFTYFIQNKKYRFQVMRLLQGEVFDRDEVPVLDAMRKFIESVEKSPNHAFREQLTDLPIADQA